MSLNPKWNVMLFTLKKNHKKNKLYNRKTVTAFSDKHIHLHF